MLHLSPVRVCHYMQDSVKLTVHFWKLQYIPSRMYYNYSCYFALQVMCPNVYVLWCLRPTCMQVTPARDPLFTSPSPRPLSLLIAGTEGTADGGVPTALTQPPAGSVFTTLNLNLSPLFSFCVYTALENKPKPLAPQRVSLI